MTTWPWAGPTSVVTRTMIVGRWECQRFFGSRDIVWVASLGTHSSSLVASPLA